jgi:Xaa-Pro aminopeptidase
MHAERLERVRSAAREAGVDAILLTPGANLRWLTGYAALPLERLTCLVLPTDGEPRLVVPRLERPAAEASPAGAGLDILDWDETDDPFALVASVLGGAARVALDDHMWASRVMALRDAVPGAEQVLAGPVIGPVRAVKSADEVDALRRAARAIDSVHARMGEWLRPGRTEREVGRDVADAIRDAGHDTVDFVIVASGPNGASPHHDLSDRVVRSGDPVVVDIGGTTPDGYCSDSTRTYAVGTPPQEFLAYYEVLQRAQAAAVAAVRPGVTAESVDAAARDLITEHGWGERFVHRTGHGIGVETHEDPYVVAGNTEPLVPGHAFSVEPGIYLPGQHGARIEDIVVCTADGVESLNRTTRDLVVLPG